MQATETEGLEGKLDDENSGTADFSGVEKESRLPFLGNAQTGEIRELQVLSSLSNCQSAPLTVTVALQQKACFPAKWISSGLPISQALFGI